MAEKKKCPACGALAVVPIVYGLSSTDTFERAERGEVLLGGCVVWEDAPQGVVEPAGQGLTVLINDRHSSPLSHLHGFSRP